MEKETSGFNGGYCMFSAQWGLVLAEQGQARTVIRFVLRDGRICENDARLVWTSVQSLIRHTKAGRFVDEMVWRESESADLTMSIAGRLKNAGLAEVLAWLKSGEASKVIEIGIEFVRNHRAKAIEIDLLAGKFYRLHPEHIRSLAQQHGVDPSYVEQMRAYGVDVENWPMSVIPTCPVKTGPRLDGFITEHAAAQPLIRTRWGWITLQAGLVDSIKPVGGVIVGVSIYESMKGADTALGLNLDADFSAWHQHFSQAFPYLGEHVELVESDKHYQTFGFAIDPGFESEGWADLIGWLQTYALEREFERYSTALNLQPGQLSAYFKRAACPASECAALLALSAQLHAPSPLTY